MHPRAHLRSLFAAIDGLVALALVIAPALLDTSGCGGVLIVFGCWGGALLAAATGIGLLMSARLGGAFATLLGIAGLVGTAWLAVDVLRSHWTPDYWPALVLFGAALVQLPFGMVALGTHPHPSPASA